MYFVDPLNVDAMVPFSKPRPLSSIEGGPTGGDTLGETGRAAEGRSQACGHTRGLD